ncbi:MAG: MarR family winged helix-turn-helix transcriptional regulator [Candidatus Hodarchaeota archaeon]
MEETRHDLIYQLTKLVIQLVNLPIESIRLLGNPSLMRGKAEFYLMEFVILDYINGKGNCNMTDIVTAFSIPPSTATRFVDRLVERDYVRRTHSSVDRRQINLELTFDGQLALRKYFPGIMIAMAAPLQTLTNAEIETLVKLITKIATGRSELEIEEEAV